MLKVLICERWSVGATGFPNTGSVTPAIQVVERVRGLEPGAGESKINVNGIHFRKLKVHPVEDVLFVSLVMKHGKFRRIEKTAAFQSAGGNEVSPILAAVAQVDPDIGGAKAAIGSRDAALGGGHALSRARGHVDYDAGLLSEFGGRRAGDDFHRLNGIERNLVGKNLALLVGDGLAIDGKGIFRVVAQAMEEAVGIGGDSRRRQSHQRTQR